MNDHFIQMRIKCAWADRWHQSRDFRNESVDDRSFASDPAPMKLVGILQVFEERSQLVLDVLKGMFSRQAGECRPG